MSLKDRMRAARTSRGYFKELAELMRTDNERLESENRRLKFDLSGWEESARRLRETSAALESERDKLKAENEEDNRRWSETIGERDRSRAWAKRWKSRALHWHITAHFTKTDLDSARSRLALADKAIQAAASTLAEYDVKDVAMSFVCFQIWLDAKAAYDASKP